VTVTATTVEELRRARDAAAATADIVELRLDGLQTVSVADIPYVLDGRLRPVIVTCRPTWEHGGFSGSEEDRSKILFDASAAGAEYVDIEGQAAFLSDIIRARRGRGVVVSMHAYGAPPSDLHERALAMRATGAEVVKIAIEAQRLSDMLPLMRLADGAVLGDPDPRAGHVLVAMGEPGVASRILASRLRNRWTYAGSAVAPGQIPATRLLHEFRFRRIRPDAAIYGLVGNPIGHSLSPAMHNAGFAALGLNAAYLPLQTSDVDDFVAFGKAVKLRGASVTAPHKVAMLDRVDDVDAMARRVGALNTVVVRNGRWYGANTDVDGFLAPLVGRMALKGTRATVLGAGGAARAVAVALSEQGASVTVSARNSTDAAAVADICGGQPGIMPPRPGSWDVLVNATPCGSHASPASPMAGTRLDGEIVFDLIYSPGETDLIRDARESGCLTIGGIEMLVAQAERQFQMWTGQRPPAGLFRAAAETALSYDLGLPVEVARSTREADNV
jgi:3-dehydroquinate dehydratase/shikimate dehydrogenase